MEYRRKLEEVMNAVDSKEVTYPKNLSKKRIDYLSNINAVAFIRSIMKREKRENAISMLSTERPVQKLLDKYSVNACAYFVSSVPN